MKKVLNFVIFTLILGLLIATLSGCSPEKPADLLKRFEKANNDRDLKALMDCYDPDAMSFFNALGGAAAGKSVDTNAILPFLSKALQNYVEGNDVYAKVEFTEISTNMINDNKATLKYNEKLIFSDGTAKNSTQTLTVIKTDGRWYISLF